MLHYFQGVQAYDHDEEPEPDGTIWCVEPDETQGSVEPVLLDVESAVRELNRLTQQRDALLAALGPDLSRLAALERLLECVIKDMKDSPMVSRVGDLARLLREAAK